MPRNYDTTNHKPFPRAPEIRIGYSALGVPSIEYVEQMAVVDGDGVVQHLSTPASRHVMDLSKITEPVQMVSPATAQPVLGKMVTRQELTLGILAFVRADQLRRDADADAAKAAANATPQTGL